MLRRRVVQWTHAQLQHGRMGRGTLSQAMAWLSLVLCIVILSPALGMAQATHIIPLGTQTFKDQVNAALNTIKNTSLTGCLSPEETHIIDTLNSPSSYIIIITETNVPLGSHTEPADNTTAINGTGTGSHIEWNPNDTSNYADGVAPDPTATLLHELRHALDANQGSWLDPNLATTIDPSTGINKQEITGTGFENAYRHAKNLDLRTAYGRDAHGNLRLLPTLGAIPVNTTDLFPPVAPICEALDPTVSEFTVFALLLSPSETYDLSLTGSANGVMINAPVGSITTDATGSTPAELFILPQIPGHVDWPLIAKPRHGGYCPNTWLATGTAVCFLRPTSPGTNGIFSVIFDGGSGWKPGGTVTYTVHVVGDTTATVTVNQDGSAPAATIPAQCVTGFTPTFQANGPNVDDPNVTLPAPSLFTCP